MNFELNILIVDDVHKSFMDELNRIGVGFNYQPNIKVADISRMLNDYNGIVLRSKLKIDAEFLSAQPQLKVIARAGSGLDNIDLEEAQSRGITCINAGEANADAVAEHALGMLLALRHRIIKSNRQLVQHTWDREGNRGLEIKGKTVGIIGYGNTGSAFATKLRGLGCRVLAYDKYKTNFGNETVEEVTLDEIELMSDVISFHIPLTHETKNWINETWLAKLKLKPVLLNLSRGGIMVIADVIDALKQGQISHFGSDVLPNERLQSYIQSERQAFDWLNDQENVVLTPHVAGWTVESYRKISEVLSNKIEALISGKINQSETEEKNRQIVG